MELVGLGLPLQGPVWTEYARVRGICGCAGEERETLCACSPMRDTRNSYGACFWKPPASLVCYQQFGPNHATAVFFFKRNTHFTPFIE